MSGFHHASVHLYFFGAAFWRINILSPLLRLESSDCLWFHCGKNNLLLLYYGPHPEIGLFAVMHLLLRPY